MKHITLSTLFVLTGIIVFAQMNFNVNGLNLSADKNPPSPAQKQRLEKVRWSAVVSKCIKPGGVPSGNWFTYRAKSTDATITLKTGEKWGNIQDPILYVGTVIENKGQEILKEVACSSLSGDIGEVVLAFNDLELKKDYFILVGSYTSERGDLFVLHIAEKYAPVAREAKPKGERGRYVMGPYKV